MFETGMEFKSGLGIFFAMICHSKDIIECRISG